MWTFYFTWFPYPAGEYAPPTLYPPLSESLGAVGQSTERRLLLLPT